MAEVGPCLQDFRHNIGQRVKLSRPEIRSISAQFLRFSRFEHLEESISWLFSVREIFRRPVAKSKVKHLPSMRYGKLGASASIGVGRTSIASPIAGASSKKCGAQVNRLVPNQILL